MDQPAGSPTGSSPTETARSEAALAARDGYGRLLALLASASGDIPAAEDALADAFERALTRWPEDGVPRSPEGWLLTVARNRLKDHWKSAAVRTSISLDPARHDAGHLAQIDPDAIGDHRLELMLVCAHPAIGTTVRTPLMLNTVLGFTAAQIAVALALPPTTLAARLVRAKRRIKDAAIPFAIPDRTVLAPRLEPVLEAVYGSYAIDWTITGPEQRPTLAPEALHLAETLARLVPEHSETHGLAALVSLSSARASARTDERGRFVPLAQQDTGRWDHDLIARGQAHLRAAHTTGGLGRYSLEAAVQAVHCARQRTGVTDWQALLDLHRSLHRLAPTLGSGVALAVATAETTGPEAGLALLDDLEGHDQLGRQAGRFQPAWTARAHLLDRLGRTTEAGTAYQKAISLTTDPAERRHLADQRARRPSAPDQPGP